MSSQTTLSRFINQNNTEKISWHFSPCFDTALTQLVIKQKQHQIIIDLDSTHSDAYRKQEDSTFNTHYRAEGFHPLVAFDILSGILLVPADSVFAKSGIHTVCETVQR